MSTSKREHVLKQIEQVFLDEQATGEFRPEISYVPVSGKVIGADDVRLMVEACLDGWLTTGRFNSDFETKLAEFIGVKYAMTVNSGSSANLVAFASLTSALLGKRAIRPGDEVICVAAAFPTTVNPILQYGAIPVFADVNTSNYNINIESMYAAFSSRTKAVFIAHTLGNPFDLAPVREFCERHELWLIEDCCDALGSEYDGKKVGTYGDLATLSFYPAHHITMGEGGAVLTNSPKLKKIAESFRDWGRDCWCAPGKDDTCGKRFGWTLGELPRGYDHKYIYSHTGYNLKITDMQAACGLGQLSKIGHFIQRRRENFDYLREKLERHDKFFELPVPTQNSAPSWFGFLLTLKKDAPFKRLELLEFLEKKRIGTRLLFAGNITRQPYMKGQPFRISTDLKNTDLIMNNTFWLGVFPGLTKPMLDHVANVFEDFIKQRSR